MLTEAQKAVEAGRLAPRTAVAGMRILAVDHALPSERVTTDEILSELYDRNVQRMGASRARALEARVRQYLEHAGTDIRYRVPPEQRPLDVLAQAV